MSFLSFLGPLKTTRFSSILEVLLFGHSSPHHPRSNPQIGSGHAYGGFSWSLSACQSISTRSCQPPSRRNLFCHHCIVSLPTGPYGRHQNPGRYLEYGKKKPMVRRCLWIHKVKKSLGQSPSDVKGPSLHQSWILFRQGSCVQRPRKLSMV